MKKIHPLRLLIKTILFFVLANFIFALWNPPVERLSVYNTIFPGRTRFPFPEGERTVSIDNLEALFASHIISSQKGHDEFRVVIIGDSSVWGDTINSDQTLSAKLNALSFECSDKDILFYNLGFPHLAVTKDILFLDKAMEYQPDMIIWAFTLRTLLPKNPNPFLIENSRQVFTLINKYQLDYPYEELDLGEETLFDRTFIGRRQELARLFLLQILGTIVAGTESDRSPAFRPSDAPEIDYKPVENNVRGSISYLGLDEPGDISNLIWLNYFQAGESIAGELPILFVNEPMFIASGENNDIRYNDAYPKWAYDQYRQIMFAQADSYQRSYIDLWNEIPPGYFTDDIFHLTPEGEQLMAEALYPDIQEMICGQ
jgi:hypothetical protein